MEKRIITLVAIFVIAANVAIAQSYTNAPSDSFVTNAGMDALKVATISQVHSGSDTLNLKWEKVSESIPAGWDVSLCDYAHCYTTLPDSGSMDPVLPGDAGLMSLHITPHINSGTAIVRYALWDINNVSLRDTLTWVINSNYTGVLPVVAKKGIVYSSGKVVYVNNSDGFYSNLVVYDLSGKKIITEQLVQGISTIDASLINDGLFTVVVTGNNTSEKIKIFLSNQ